MGSFSSLGIIKKATPATQERQFNGRIYGGSYKKWPLVPLKNMLRVRYGKNNIADILSIISEMQFHLTINPSLSFPLFSVNLSCYAPDLFLLPISIKKATHRKTGTSLFSFSLHRCNQTEQDPPQLPHPPPPRSILESIWKPMGVKSIFTGAASLRNAPSAMKV